MDPMQTIEILGQQFRAGLSTDGRTLVLDPCWKCDGVGTLAYYYHIFGGECFACHKSGGTWRTPAEQERVMRRREADRARRARKASAKLAKIEADRAAFAQANPELAFMNTDAIFDEDAEIHPILRDMGARLQQYGSLSDKQRDFAKRLLIEAQEKQARRDAERAAAQPAPEGRATIEGEVIKAVYKTETHGYHDRGVYRITIKTDAGWVANGNAPRELVDDVYTRFTPAGEAASDYLKGRRVRLVATVEPKGDDPTFAFFKRPTKPEVLS